MGLGCDVVDVLEACENEEPNEGIDPKLDCVFGDCCWNRGLRRGKLLIVSNVQLDAWQDNR